MGNIFQDVRYGARMLLKNKGVTLIAVISLALGIGANVGVFSIVNGLLFRPLRGVRAPERLVALYTSDYSGPLYGASSYPDYVDIRQQTNAFDDLAAHTVRPMSMSVGGEAERILSAVVTGNYFNVLGVSAARGRTFTLEEDEQPDAPPIVVVSHGLWQRRFGSDSALVGQTIVLGGQPFTVAGITPPGFAGTILGLSPDIFVPVNMQARAAGEAEALASRGNRGLFVLGRLKPGIETAQAQSGLDVLAHNLKAAYAEQWTNVRGEGRRLSLLSESESRVPPQISTAVFGVAGLLTVVVGLVLLIACANVASLLLARACVRRKEIAVRLALGASRRRLIQQLLTESVLLALVAGTAGILVSLWVVDLLTSYTPPTPVPLALDFAPDFRVFAFALGLSIFTGLIFGLAPALQATRSNVMPALKDVGLAADSAGRRRRYSLHNLLVIAQIALSLVLLIGAGLFLHSLQNAQSINPGFRAENVLLMTPEIKIQGYDEAQSGQFYGQLLERVEGLPGVRSATLAEVVPLGFSGQRSGIHVEGYERRPGEDREVDFNVIGTRYFETMGINLLAGRDFTPRDVEGAPGVVVVNESFIRRFYAADQNPLGQRISVSGAEGPFLEIVGVARDGKYNTLGEAPLPFFYLPHGQRQSAEMTLLVRTNGDPRQTLAPAREEIR
ncbi:MAG: ABC transporter permease, partial [Pyrinomonadaceae bacterium]